MSCCCCCTSLLLHRSWLFRANWEVAKPIFPHKDPASNITNRQNSISSISSYNFTIPPTTKEITQTCRTLPILIIFLVYILPLRLSVSLSLCLSHPKSLSVFKHWVTPKCGPAILYVPVAVLASGSTHDSTFRFPSAAVTATTQQTY
jgi:hypothetical protein